MAHGKREIPRTLKQKLAIAAVALLLCCSVGGTLAWLATSTGPVTNTFEPTWVECEVSDTYENGVKTNIVVTNPKEDDGDIKNVDAYIRVTFAATWEDPNDPNEPYAAVAKDTKAFYDNLAAATLNSADWFKGSDGFYYYKHIVKVGEATSQVFTSALTIPKDDTGNGYELNVQILAEAIQADGVNSSGTPAVADVWPVTVSGTTLNKA